MKRSEVSDYDYYRDYRPVKHMDDHFFLRVGDDMVRMKNGMVVTHGGKAGIISNSYSHNCMEVEGFVAKHWTIGDPPQYGKAPFCPLGNRCPECELEVWESSQKGEQMEWTLKEVYSFRNVEFTGSSHWDDSICSAFFDFLAPSYDVRPGDLRMITNVVVEDGKEDRVEIPTKAHRLRAEKMESSEDA